MSGITTSGGYFNSSGVATGSAQIPAGSVWKISTDTGLSRISAGVVGVGNGTAGNVSGTVHAANIDSGAATNLVLKYNGSSRLTVAAGYVQPNADLYGGGVRQTSFALNVGPLAGTTFSDTTYYGQQITNEGAAARADYTLITASNSGNKSPHFSFIVQDADGIRISANTGDTIRVIDKVTAAAGYIESTTIGSTVTLVSINATEWIATSIHGTWTDGTFTYDDTGNTTP